MSAVLATLIGAGIFQFHKGTIKPISRFNEYDEHLVISIP